MLQQNAVCAALTILDRFFYRNRDKINSTVKSGMSASDPLDSGRFGGGDTVVSSFFG